MSKRSAADQIDDLGEKIGGARKDTAQKLGPKRKTEKPTDDRPAWQRRYVVAEQIDRLTKLGTGRWSVLDTGKKGHYSGHPSVARDLPSEEAAKAAIPLAAVSRNHRVSSTREGKYIIQRQVTDHKRVQVVQQAFDTREAALQHMAQHAEKIVETKTGFGEEILARPEKVYRTGPQTRAGDIAGESFLKSFGFRGVEFGHWQDDRQTVLNHAFDALHDLHELTGIDPKSVSLGGDLGLAFGARGHGGKGAAAAHYERDYGAINLTKLSGAGSLAHEWWHAADHLIGRIDDPKIAQKIERNGAKVFAATERDTDYGSHRVLGYSKGQMSESVRAAYKDLMESMLRKPEQYAEDAAKAQKFADATKARVQEELAQVRRDLATERDPKYYKRMAGAADPQQLAKFDALAERILSGEAIKTEWRNVGDPKMAASARGAMVYRTTNDALEQISQVYKEVRGRSGFDSQSRHGILDRVATAMSAHEARAKVLADAAAQSLKTKMVATDFARESFKMDEGRASDYWQTKHEMAARAFSSYLEDKLAAQGRRSDYLSYGSNNDQLQYRMLGAKPFPEGSERAAINAKFDTLFDAMKRADVIRSATPMGMAAAPSAAPDIGAAMKAASGQEMAGIGRLQPQTSGGTFSSDVMRAAQATGGMRDLKYVGEVYDTYVKQTGNAIGLDEFKGRLLEAWKSRQMPLAVANEMRPDMAGEVMRSRISTGQQEWHVIDIGGTKPAGWSDAARAASAESRAATAQPPPPPINREMPPADVVERLKALGRDAHARNQPGAPALNAEVMKAIGENRYKATALMEAYSSGWTEAHAATPVPGVTDAATKAADKAQSDQRFKDMLADTERKIAEHKAKTATTAPAQEVRMVAGKRFAVYENGSPIRDSKGNDKWFGSKDKADAYLAQRVGGTPSAQKAAAGKAAPRQATAGDNQPRSVVQDVHPAADPKFTSISLKIGDESWSTSYRNEHPEGMLKHNMGSLRETYRKEIAKRFNAAVARGDTLDLKGVTLKHFGDNGQALDQVKLKPDYANALDGSRETTKGNGKRAWTAKAYSPDKLSFFGQEMPLTGKEAGVIAKALGMPSFNEVVSEIDSAVKARGTQNAADLQSINENRAANAKPKDPATMSAVERALEMSAAKGKQESTLVSPKPVINSEMREPKRQPRGMDGLTRDERAGRTAKPTVTTVAVEVPAGASTMEKFRAAYEATLTEQVKANPGRYAYGIDRVPEMARRMTAALAQGAGDTSAPTVRAVVQSLGIKPTVGGIKAALNDQPEPVRQQKSLVEKAQAASDKAEAARTKAWKQLQAGSISSQEWATVSRGAETAKKALESARSAADLPSNPNYKPGVGTTQEPYWAHKSGPTPTVAELPPGAFAGSQREFESLSPGMRREIARTAEKLAAQAESTGKVGFQNEATLNAALTAQGKAESGKAAPKPPKGFDPKRAGMRFVGTSTVLERGPVNVFLGKDGLTYSAAKDAPIDTEGRPLGLRQSPSGIDMAAAKTNRDHRFHDIAKKAPPDSLAKDFAPATPSVADLRAQAKAAGVKNVSRLSKPALMQALDTVSGKLGIAAMVGGVAGAALEASSHSAEAGQSRGQQVTEGVKAAVVAGGVGAAFSVAFTGAARVAMVAAPRIAAYAVPGVGWGLAALTAYQAGKGAVEGYAAGGVKGAAIGAATLGQYVPKAPTNAPQHLNDSQKVEFSSANATYTAMQAAPSASSDEKRGFARGDVQAAAQAALGRTFTGFMAA